MYTRSRASRGRSRRRNTFPGRGRASFDGVERRQWRRRERSAGLEVDILRFVGQGQWHRKLSVFAEPCTLKTLVQHEKPASGDHRYTAWASASIESSEPTSVKCISSVILGAALARTELNCSATTQVGNPQFMGSLTWPSSCLFARRTVSGCALWPTLCSSDVHF